MGAPLFSLSPTLFTILFLTAGTLCRCCRPFSLKYSSPLSTTIFSSLCSFHLCVILSSNLCLTTNQENFVQTQLQKNCWLDISNAVWLPTKKKSSVINLLDSRVEFFRPKWCKSGVAMGGFFRKMGQGVIPRKSSHFSPLQPTLTWQF